MSKKQSESVEAEAGITIPSSSVRGQAFLSGCDAAMAAVDGWLACWLPSEGNLLAQTGRAANLTLLVAVVSGILMFFWYSPSLHQAYSSLEAIKGFTLGGWVRALHRYSSDLVMLLLVVHAMRNLFAGKLSGARWLPWVSGVVLIGIVWFIGWTGYWLVWDQPAQQVAVSSMRFLDVLPIFGEPLSRLFLADRLVPSLLFFVVFFLHMLLPLLIAMGLALHLMRLSRVRLLPDRRLTIVLLIAMGLTSLIVPAPLDPPAAMAVKAAEFTVDAWYLTPLALGLRFQSAGLWMALGGVLVLGAGLPWILGRRVSAPRAADGTAAPAPFQTRVTESRCHACTQCVQDCPFDAVHMVARTDGKPFDSMAWVDPMRCVGCAVCVGSCDSEAMRLPWFDPLVEEARILEKIQKFSNTDEPVWIALVAADAAGGMSRFNGQRWQTRLPGYHVEPIPTASWVRPKFVERLYKAGVAGVLIVRDARGESSARDANQWVEDRLTGNRKPILRTARLGTAAGTWRVVDYTPGSDSFLRQEALAFRSGENPQPPAQWGWRAFAVSLILALLMTGLAVGPSHLKVANPVSPDPEFVFSFKAFGEREAVRQRTPEEEADLPLHMRGAPVEKPNRERVRVRMTVNGDIHEQSFKGKGISGDGPAIAAWRIPLSPGQKDIKVQVFTGSGQDPETWTGTIQPRQRHLHVLSFEPESGFILERRDGDM